MYSEHILFSIAVAISVGAWYKNKFGYAIPVWIIAACAWAPDLDYILQNATYEYLKNSPYCIIHGQMLHNMFALLLFAGVVAYIFKKYKKYDFNNVFICAAIGYATHMICDFCVYDTDFQPLFPVNSTFRIWGRPLIHEYGTWFGIGEKSIILWGIVAIITALIIKFYYSESKWIEEFSTPATEEA